MESEREVREKIRKIIYKDICKPCDYYIECNIEGFRRIIITEDLYWHAYRQFFLHNDNYHLPMIVDRRITNYGRPVCVIHQEQVINKGGNENNES